MRMRSRLFGWRVWGRRCVRIVRITMRITRARAAASATVRVCGAGRSGRRERVVHEALGEPRSRLNGRAELAYRERRRPPGLRGRGRIGGWWRGWGRVSRARGCFVWVCGSWASWSAGRDGSARGGSPLAAAGGALGAGAELIVAHHGVPWGRTFRQWDTAGRLVVWVNRGQLHDELGEPRRGPGRFGRRAARISRSRSGSSRCRRGVRCRRCRAARSAGRARRVRARAGSRRSISSCIRRTAAASGAASAAAAAG